MQALDSTPDELTYLGGARRRSLTRARCAGRKSHFRRGKAEKTPYLLARLERASF